MPGKRAESPGKRAEQAGLAEAHIIMFLEMSKRHDHAMRLNPVVWDCSRSEDFVGKVAKVARQSWWGFCQNIVCKTLMAHLDLF